MKKNIIIEGHKSDWYEKAIFVLKDSKHTQIPKNLVTHADDILEKRMKIGEYTYQSNEKKSFNWDWIDGFFEISLGILGISIIFYFLFR